MPPSTKPTRHDVTPQLLRGWPLPSAGNSKYSRGQVVVVGGALRSPGAAMLAGEAALRVGAGRLTLAVAASVAAQVAVAFPEAGVVPLVETIDGHIEGDAIRAVESDLSAADAVLVGPGLDDAEEAARLVALVPDLVGRKTAVVLDAFALGVLPDLRAQLTPLAGRLILTPNSDEAERLAGRSVADSESAISMIAKKYGAVVSCQNLVVSPDGEAWSTGTGTGGLGTSGSGDVLAGAVTGLVARGATAAQAAVWGTYLHANAGDAQATRLGPVGFLARELLPELPILLNRLRPE